MTVGKDRKLRTFRSRTSLLIGLCLVFFSHARGKRSGEIQSFIAGQVGFNITVSFIGKMLVHHEAPGCAIKQALKEGTVSGLVAHAGYTIASRNPYLALVGKALAQKSSLTTHRSIQGLQVFDETFFTHWELSHSFVHFKWDGSPHVQLDAINAAFIGYYFLSPDQYKFDAKRTLLSGSVVFKNQAPAPGVRGYYLPGVIWIDATHKNPQWIFSHEVIHSLQAERGAAIKEWHYDNVRFNWLVFASGVPAFLTGWPEHDTRWHEIEAKKYAGPNPR